MRVYFCIMQCILLDLNCVATQPFLELAHCYTILDVSVNVHMRSRDQCVHCAVSAFLILHIASLEVMLM